MKAGGGVPGWLGLRLAGVCLFLAPGAAAYCQTTTCAQKKPVNETCTLPPAGECQMLGKPVAWPTACTSFSVQVDGSAKQGIAAGDVEDLLRLSFDNWQASDCGNGKHPAIRVETYPQVECSEVFHNNDGPNQNVWTFRDKNWVDADHTAEMIALTTVQFLPSSGKIVDVDEEFNSDIYAFATSTAESGVDLQSVIQHESGHFLGLAHSFKTTATMFFGYDGNAAMRTLDSDDEDGLCSIYPPNDSALKNCDAEPAHGFSTQCDDSSPDGGCSCTLEKPIADSTTSRTALVLALLGFGIFRRRSAAF